MPPSLFHRIMADVVQHDSYFKQRRDAAGRNSFSPQQKLTSSLRMLAYGCSADSLDKYCRMGESTTLECLRKFCTAIITIYGPQYLRAPTVEDLRRLLDHSSRCGFPGMIGSIDCMHWEWKNCPSAWAGQYTVYKKKPSIVLEVVASYDTWICHAFFGTPGSNNDINTLGVSPLFDEAVRGFLPKVSYEVNVEDQRDEFGDDPVENIEYDTNPDVTWDPPDHDTPTLTEYMARHNRIRDRPGHHALRNNLIEHLWTKSGGE
ncbi:hypothetical protein LINGRAHAP2_LOCUS29464 [Linum grandiflorum]